MPTLPIYDVNGSRTGELEVPADVFGVAPNNTLLHDAVLAGLAAARQGTAHTKTRGEVAGSGRKLWRQKGTGRARVGDRRPPSRVGGGTVGGPRMRSYRQRLSRRAKAEALRAALSARARAGALAVLEPFDLPDPKTKALAQLLAALGAEGRVLLVPADASQTIWRCGRNVPGLTIRPAAEISGYDVMAARKVILLSDAVARLEARLSPGPDSPEESQAERQSDADAGEAS